MSEDKKEFIDQLITDDEKKKYLEFSTSGYLVINKKLLKTFGPLESIFISNLVDQFLFFLKMGKLTLEGTFFHTHKKQSEELNICEETIRRLKKTFIDNKILETKMKGSPAKEHYKINIEKLKEILENNKEKFSPRVSSAPDETRGLASDETRGLITNLNNNEPLSSNIINNINKDFSNPKSSFKQISSRRKTFNELPKEKPSQKQKNNSQLEFIKPNTWADCILKEWNKLPLVTNHKNKPTKIIKRTVKFINYLRDGVIADHCQIKPEFLENNNIPIDWLLKSKKFTKREIINAINTFRKHLTYGYFPDNKDFLPHNLDGFIFDSFNGSSWFLKCVANPDPKPIAEERKNIDPNPQYTKYFQERGILKHFSEKDYPSVYKGISTIENFVIQDKIIDFTLPNPTRSKIIGIGKGQLEPLFKGYAQYLKSKREIEDSNKIFYIYGYFKDYLEDLQNNYSSFRINF